VDKLQKNFKRVVFNLSNCNDNYQKYSYHLNYESSKYSQDKLVRIMMSYLPKFALTEEEYQIMKEEETELDILEKAYSRFVKGNIARKGDFGELLLFLFLVSYFGSDKILTKFLLKTNPQKQVNGFDAIHFSLENDIPIFWFGEVKFYKKFSDALSDIVNEINEHITDDFLKQEFSILVPHIELNKGKELLKDTIKEKVDFRYSSLDEVQIKIPALITYESIIVKRYSQNNEEFLKKIESEFQKKFNSINKQIINKKVNIEIIFLILALEDVTQMKKDLENELQKH